MASPNKQRYASDMTDEQWTELEPLLARRPGDGAPTRKDLREVVNALLYLGRSGPDGLPVAPVAAGVR